MADEHADSKHIADLEQRTKLAEARLEESLRRAQLERARLQTVLDTVPSGVIVVEGPDARVVFMNRRSQQFFGTPPDVAEPLPAYLASSRLLHPDGSSFLPEDLPLVKSLTNGEVVRGEELIIETEDGKRHCLLLGSAPLYDERGRIYGAVASTEDITSLREAQEALRKAYERERRVSETLQLALLPNIPERLDGIRLASVYRAASEEGQIGGDFFDVFVPAPGLVGIVIGDVAGKGVDAAVLTALTRHSLRAFSYSDPSPAFTMERVNDVILRETIPESFVTAFYGLLDTQNRTLSYANAGHESPLLLIPDDSNVVELPKTGMALGVRTAETYEQGTLEVAEGNRILLYTDGVTEARSSEGFFGLGRLKEFMLSHKQDSPGNFLDRLVERVEAFSFPHRRDDVAVLLVEMNSQ